MPTIIDYPLLLKTMESQGFKSLYYNSGAFGFSNPQNLSHLGWITRPDPTLRPAMQPLATLVPHPAQLATHAWLTHLPGPAWIMPMSHWAYELDFGNPDWLPSALHQIQIDPATLQHTPTGDALEFPPHQSPQFLFFLDQLLHNLKSSDFMLAFPTHPLLCTIHHHHQLWWTTNNEPLLNRLRNVTSMTLLSPDKTPPQASTP